MADTQADHRLSGIGGVLAKCNTTSGETGIAGVPHLGHIGIMVIVFSANVSVHRRRTLCAVRCDALFNAFIFPDFHARKSKISIIRPENRVLGLVEPIFSIFRPFFEVIFGFRGIARIFIRIFFLCSRGRRYFTVISDISGR